MLDRAALSEELASSRTLNTGSARDLLVRLETAGLTHGDSEISLTAKGRALQHSLSEYITAPRVRLLSQFSIDDIDTTLRTLQAIAERAAEEMAGQ